MGSLAIMSLERMWVSRLCICRGASLSIGNQHQGGSYEEHTQVYVLTLNAPSRKTVRLWTGASIHSLRHCSSKKIDRTPSIALDNVLQPAGDIHREGVQPSCRMI